MKPIEPIRYIVKAICEDLRNLRETNTSLFGQSNTEAPIERIYEDLILLVIV